MSRADAEALWGVDAVTRALAEPEPAPLTTDLRAAIRRYLGTDAEFAAWGRTLDSQTFAAVVRVVTGDARRDLLDAARRGGTEH